MADMQSIPAQPPAWWPYSDWPPKGEREFEVGKDEAWFANIKREFDLSGSPEREKDYNHQGLKVKREASQEALVSKLDGDIRAAEKAQKEDTRNAGIMLLDQRMRFSDAIWASYLNHKQNLDTTVMQIIADNLQDARVARHVTYNVPLQKLTDAALLEALADKFETVSAKVVDVMAEVMSLKEFMGPPRGGVEPKAG